jgi:hypothetical protein
LKFPKSSCPIGQFFSCIISELRDTKVNWYEVMPFLESSRTKAIRLELYVWPMIIEWRSGSKLLRYCSLN